MAVSPIGAYAFFGQRGLEVLASEAAWIALSWLPPFVVLLSVTSVRQWRANGRGPRD